MQTTKICKSKHLDYNLNLNNVRKKPAQLFFCITDSYQ